MKRIYLIAVLLLGANILGCQQSSSTVSAGEPEVKNVILLIGDGMGLVQLYSAMTVSEQPLAIEGFKTIGFSKTYSADDYNTDSAASGTAMASGVKTRNGMIGMSPDSIAVETVLEKAEKAGLATGLISTSAITHATPASFIAHNINRGNYEELAADFLNTDIDVFIGGGRDYFAFRDDERDLLKELDKKKYKVVETLEEMKDVRSGKLAALLAPGHMPTYEEGRGDMLPEATQKAIEILSQNDKGFFMMVEGSQIDWAGHDNDLRYLLQETLDFDRAVARALAFAMEDKHTLVIVTADHETGGMIVSDGDIENHEVEAIFGRGGHTGIMVPVFTYGPGAERFTGIYENTEINKAIRELLNLQ